MEAYFLLGNFVLILPTLLGVVFPDFYETFTEDTSIYNEGEEYFMKNHRHFSSSNPLTEVFQYMKQIRPNAHSTPNTFGPLLYNSAGTLSAIWSVMAPNGDEQDEDETWTSQKEKDDAKSALTKFICSENRGPFSIYFPQKPSNSCLFVRTLEDFMNAHFWQMMLLLSSFATYQLLKQDAVKANIERLLDLLIDNPFFTIKLKRWKNALSGKGDFDTDIDSENESDEFDNGSGDVSCQCEVCSAQLSALILLKQKLEELKSTSD